MRYILKILPALGLLIGSIPLSLNAQSISLQACLDSAEANLPILQQAPLIRQSLENKLSTFENQNLPQINFTGQATYQSAVPELPFTIPGSPGLEIPKTQFRTYVEISQPIYTGGVSKALSGVESANALYKLDQLKIPTLAIKKQVTEVYFSLLEAAEQKEALNETLGLLREKEKTLQSALKNGVAQENDLLKLQVELTRLSHQVESIDNRITGAREILGILCGFDVSSFSLFQPASSPTDGGQDLNANPEIQLYDTQKKSLMATNDLLDANRKPKVFAFGQTGLGQPNPYNIFESDVSGFYMIGAKVQWTLTDWGNTRIAKENISLGMEQLDVLSQQKEVELKAQTSRLQTEIEALNTQLKMDNELLVLKQQIAKNALTQYNEGIITFTQYLEELLALKQVEINKASHEATLLKSQTLLQLEYGNL